MRHETATGGGHVDRFILFFGFTIFYFSVDARLNQAGCSFQHIKLVQSTGPPVYGDPFLLHQVVDPEV